MSLLPSQVRTASHLKTRESKDCLGVYKHTVLSMQNHTSYLQYKHTFHNPRWYFRAFSGENESCYNFSMDGQYCSPIQGIPSNSNLLLSHYPPPAKLPGTFPKSTLHWSFTTSLLQVPFSRVCSWHFHLGTSVAKSDYHHLLHG